MELLPVSQYKVNNITNYPSNSQTVPVAPKDKKNLSSAEKASIACVGGSVIVFLDFLCAKGKHVKYLFKCFKNNKNTQSSVSGTKSNNVQYQTPVKSSVSKKTNITVDINTPSNTVNAQKNLTAIIKGNKEFAKAEFQTSITKFLEETGDDYTLLNSILNNKELAQSKMLSSILRNTTANNKIILNKYIQNPNSIRMLKTGSSVEQPISHNQLNLLIQLNRHNKNVEKLIDSPKEVSDFLVKTGQILLEKTSKNPKLTRMCNVLVTGSRLSDATVETPALLNSNILDDIENLVHGKSYIKQFKIGKPQAEILKETKIGEAFSINGEMFIKESENNLFKLDYSEKVFEKLFPPVDRFNITQGNLGDCYFVSAINSLMNTPKGRNEIYKMFKGSTENQLLVTSIRSPHTYKFQRFDNEGRHLLNENGLSIVEQYFAACEATTGLKYPLKVTEEELMKQFGGGGLPYNISRRLVPVPSQNLNQFAHDEKELIKLLKDNMNNENTIINFGTKDLKMSTNESLLDERFYLYSKHAYSIKKYNMAQNTVIISNPWSGAIDIEIPISELSKHIDYNNGVSFLNLT